MMRNEIRPIRRGLLLAVAGTLTTLLSGCGDPSANVGVLPKKDRDTFRADCLKFMEDSAFSLEPSLRMQAIEAFADVAPKEGIQRKAIPLNIENKYDGIVFASLMAVGQIQSKQFEEQARTRAESRDKNIRIAALFALHQLGERSRTGELAEMLINDPDEQVRANAALAIGRTHDPRMIKPLRLALRREHNQTPKMQILEALAILGDKKAIERLMFIGRSAIPQDAGIALMMLANARTDEAEDLFWIRLQDADVPEVRVLAIRGLAGLGKRDVLPLAVKFLFFNEAKPGIPHDPPEQQIKRIRGIAALALEQLGAPEALEPLKKAFYQSGQSDYVRLAAARAAVGILDHMGAR